MREKIAEGYTKDPRNSAREEAIHMKFLARLLLLGCDALVPAPAADGCPASASESARRVPQVTEAQFLSARS